MTNLVYAKTKKSNESLKRMATIRYLIDIFEVSKKVF